MNELIKLDFMLIENRVQRYCFSPKQMHGYYIIM